VILSEPACKNLLVIQKKNVSNERPICNLVGTKAIVGDGVKLVKPFGRREVVVVKFWLVTNPFGDSDGMGLEVTILKHSTFN